MVDASAIGERYAAVRRSLDERGRRLFVAAEARTAGHGGITAAARATGIARSTIGRGLKDLDDPGALSGVVRRPGSGRHALTVTDPTLLEDLRRLLEPATMGDPVRPLLLGLEKPREAGSGAVCDGTPDWQEQHSKAARPAEVPPAGEPQDPRRQPQSRP